MTLGEKLKDARKRAGLSQEQLSEKLNVSRSAVAKWETDKGIPDVENSTKSGKGSIIRLRKEDEPAMQTAAAKEAEDKLIADVLKEFLS